MLKMIRSRQNFLRSFASAISIAALLVLFTFPALATNAVSSVVLVGPKSHYIALGDSLAFGYQPNLDFVRGYTDDFAIHLLSHGTRFYDNKSCVGETSTTFINGGCRYEPLRKQYYPDSQLSAALKYLRDNAGKVSPVTLDIGANDLLHDFDPSTCSVSSTFDADLERLDKNLTQIILPKLKSALTVNGQVTGDLIVMNYYDPYQNLCPNTVSYIQTLNQHLANDVKGYGIIVDVFSQFGGATTPNVNICTYTWMCSSHKDIHATNKGYQAIAQAFKDATGY